MRKKDIDTLMDLILTIVEYYREDPNELYKYLHTDVYMQLRGDLEAFRKKDFPLPYSGVIE